MSKSSHAVIEELDQEWVELILLAREMGLTVEDVRDYLHHSSTSFKNSQNAL